MPSQKKTKQVKCRACGNHVALVDLRALVERVFFFQGSNHTLEEKDFFCPPCAIKLQNRRPNLAMIKPGINLNRGSDNEKK